MSIVEIGSALLSRTQSETDMAAHNMVNVTTPGYKARRLFAEVLLAGQGQVVVPAKSLETIDFTPGKIETTGSPLDLAIQGEGFFAVRSESGLYYTRNGQFSRDEDGRLVTAQGYALQSESGDVVTTSPDFAVTSDGVILEEGEPTARIAVLRFEDNAVLRTAEGGLFEAPGDIRPQAATPQLQQGALETSNVSNVSEMLALMASLRRAESGQRLIQIYDDLLGRALTVFGQA